MTVKLNTGNPVSKLDRLDNRGRKTDAGPDQPEKSRPGAHQADQVKISSFARAARQAGDATSIQDSQRAEKIAALKQQVADGSYKPDARAVATSLLKHILKDR